ncbi:MAG: nuclear transport factor 2 family protein [Actinomycetota bacterium]|nr:nuclear transport factor 2 family protein [Actinomycetota bacterium]
MQSSPDVRAAMLRFYDRLSAGDVDAFDSIVSSDPATVVIGTAIGEIHRDRAKLRAGFEAEGIELVASDPVAYEEESMGWVIDEPTFVFGDVGRVVTRLTAVFHREGDTWKLVHMHASVGVPDEEVFEFQARWGVTG